MGGKPEWIGSSEEMISEGRKQVVKTLERDLKMAINLIKNTKCIHCDGSGAIPSGNPEDPDWEQCQWCDESKWLIENYEDML